jgi:hypothetical protein
VGVGVWDEYGHIELGAVFGDAIWDALEAEASELYPDAVEDGFTTTAQFRDGSICSPSKYAHHRGGPTFQSVLRSRELLETIRAETGLTRLIPVRCGYNYYRRGDFMGPHRDSIKATVTLSFGLTDNLGAMGWAPDLRHSPNTKVANLIDETGLFPPDRSDGMKIPYRSINAFDGYNIPHWRTPFEHDLGILGNFCYFDL